MFYYTFSLITYHEHLQIPAPVYTINQLAFPVCCQMPFSKIIIIFILLLQCQVLSHNNNILIIGIVDVYKTEVHYCDINTL